jgi:hypothetical protein
MFWVLRLLVLPGDEKKGFKLEVKLNLPIEPIKIENDKASVMVCELSGKPTP